MNLKWRRAVKLARPVYAPSSVESRIPVDPILNDSEANPLWNGRLGMTESGYRTHAFNRRGCVTLAVVAGLFLLLLIAISFGWLGQIDRFKNTEVPVMKNNQT
jgi:hypothetical protein